MRLYAPGGARLYVNTAERRRFLAVADTTPPPVRSLCLTLAYTGCRISEALSLTPESIQTEAAVIAIATLKKRKRSLIREVPVPESLIERLVVDHGLAGPRGRMPHYLWPVCRATAWRQVKRIMDEAGIAGPQATAKGLRHGFGVHALQSGVPLNLLQRWMGHAHISITAIYGNAVGPEERAIAERMW